MICPNCGAEMEMHAFTHVCLFCDTIIVQNETQSNSKYIDEIKNSSRFYDYISSNFQTIEQSPFVKIINNQDCYECSSSKPFYPNDGQYTLDKELSLSWRAIISKQKISFLLLVKSQRTNPQNHICIKIGKNEFSFKQHKEEHGVKVFLMSLDDFILICNASDLAFDTNLYENAYKNDYQEFVTYSHRFYNTVLDKSKYRYAINMQLLTDLN